MNLEPSTGQRLKVLIDAALERNGVPDWDIATSLASAEPVLVTDWAREQLARFVRLRRKQPKPSDPAQAAFPFHDLSTPLPLKDGPMELRLATVGILKQSLKFLSAKKKTAIENPRRNSMLGKLEREIEIMQPYVYGNRRITVEEVHALIARGTPPPPRDGKMSEAMRRYWEGKSPEERSAIAKRREVRKKRNRL